MLSNSQIFELKARIGTAYMHTDVQLDTDPTSSTYMLVKLSLSDNDPLTLIPFDVARPYALPTLTNGIYLGYDIDGVTETPNLSNDPVGLFGSTVDPDVRIQKESISVKAKLMFNNDQMIKKLFYPPGFRSGSLFTFGGDPNYIKHNLLLIYTNIFRPQEVNPNSTCDSFDDVFECHLYERGYFVPSTFISGKIFNPLDMTYIGLSALDANGCTTAAGSRLCKIWWVKIQNDGTNILVDPEHPELDPADESIISQMLGSAW